MVQSGNYDGPQFESFRVKDVLRDSEVDDVVQRGVPAEEEPAAEHRPHSRGLLGILVCHWYRPFAP